MRTLLNLAALQGVSLLDILLRPQEAASRPLFDNSSEFEGVPFPPAVVPEATHRVQRVASALLADGAVLLPPLYLLCRLERVQPDYVRKFHEGTCASYSAAYARQSLWRPGTTMGAARAVKAALNLAIDNPGLTAEALVARLQPIAPVTYHQLVRIAESAVLVEQIQRGK